MAMNVLDKHGSIPISPSGGVKAAWQRCPTHSHPQHGPRLVLAQVEAPMKSD